MIADSEKAPRLVVLRFASGMLVDIVDDATSRAAIADFTSRALALETTELPLVEAIAVAIPIERLRKVATDQVERAAAAAAPPASIPKLSVAGVVAAVNRYTRKLGNDRSNLSAGADELVEFFARYSVDLDFRVAVPPSRTEPGEAKL